METIDIPVDDVIVGDRIRKDLGDTTSLMLSMERQQLHPIGVDTDNRLIFGARRLDAAKRAGWATIRATRFSKLNDAVARLKAERDENEEAKPFTPSEKVALGERLEALEKPKAEARKGGRPRRDETDGKFPSVSESSERRVTRDIVGEAVGFSGKTYEKAKAVVKAAEQPDAPPAVKAAAEAMDRTGKVEPAYQVVKAATGPKVDPVAAKRADILQTLAPLEKAVRELADLDPAVDRSKAIEALGKLIAAVQGKKRRPLAKPTDERDRQVEALWAAYPRKVGKGAAVRAIVAALKLAPFDVLLAAVEEYADAKDGEDPQYIPHPATWFNGRRWEDDRSDWRVRGGPKPVDPLAGLREATRAGPSGIEIEPGVELIPHPETETYDGPIPF